MKTSLIRIDGRDNWTESFLDRIEATTRGTIQSTRADGAGGMLFLVRTDRTSKSEAKEVLVDLRAIGVNKARFV